MGHVTVGDRLADVNVGYLHESPSDPIVGKVGDRQPLPDHIDPVRLDTVGIPQSAHAAEQAATNGPTKGSTKEFSPRLGFGFESDWLVGQGCAIC